MKTYEVNIMVAKGRHTITIKASSMLDAIAEATRNINEGLSELAKNCLNEITIREI